MLKSLKLRVGRYSDRRSVTVPTSPMTVLIGPNNSGKSLLLRELRNRVDGSINPGVQILLDPQYSTPSDDDLEYLFSEESRRRFPSRSRQGDDRVAFSRPRSGGEESVSVSRTKLRSEWSEHQQRLASIFSMHLAGDTRLRSMLEATEESVDEPLSGLVYDAERTRRLSSLVHEATGWHFCIEARPMAKARALLSRAPIPSSMELSFAAEAEAFWKSCTSLEDLSDGMRSFVSLLGSYLCGDFRVFTVDEPEAFLHPPMARRLGRLLAELSAEMHATTIAASHSPEFLLGCVQAAVDTTVVRLTYRDEVAESRVIPPNDLKALMFDPLLRSTGMLNALFHQAAVVVEGDSDRAFYEEINLRLQALSPPLGSPDCCFINANGKDSLDRIVAMLRRAGVPAVAVADLDLLREGKLTSLLRAAGLPEDIRQAIMSKRNELTEAIDERKLGATGTSTARSPDGLTEALSTFASYGVFLVPVGELERWLSSLGANGHGPKWLADIFNRMGSNRDDPNYVRPGTGDVWDFVARIGRWLDDDGRAGMPMLTWDTIQ